MKPLQQPHVPIFFGGANEAALRVAGKHANAYALWGEPLAEARELIPRLRALVAEREARGQNVNEEAPQLQAACWPSWRPQASRRTWTTTSSGPSSPPPHRWPRR